MPDETPSPEVIVPKTRPVLTKDYSTGPYRELFVNELTLDDILNVDRAQLAGTDYTHIDAYGKIVTDPEKDFVVVETNGRIDLDKPPEAYVPLPDSGQQTTLREVEHAAEVYLVISKTEDDAYYLDTTDNVLAEFVQTILDPYIRVEGPGNLINDVTPAQVKMALSFSLSDLLREVRPRDRVAVTQKINADLRLLQDIYFLRSVQKDKKNTKIWNAFFEEGINMMPKIFPQLNYDHDPRSKNGLFQLAVMQGGVSVEVEEAIDLYSQLYEVPDPAILQKYLVSSTARAGASRQVTPRKVENFQNMNLIAPPRGEAPREVPELKWYRASGEEIDAFLKGDPVLTQSDVAGILGAVGEGRYVNNAEIQKLKLVDRVHRFRREANRILTVLDGEALAKQNSVMVISETAALQMIQYGHLANEMRRELPIGFLGDTLLHTEDKKPIFLVDSIVNIGRLGMGYLGPMTEGYSTTSDPNIYIPRVRMFLHSTRTPDGKAVYGDPFKDFVQEADGWSGSLNTMQRHFYVSHIHHEALGDSYHGLPSQGDFRTAEEILFNQGQSETRFSLFTFTLRNDSLSIFAADCIKQNGKMLVKQAMPIIVPDSGAQDTITPNAVQDERSFSYDGRMYYRQRLSVKSLIR